LLLTITNKGNNATDLGFLLHKNPQRPQTIELSYGKAHIFYPVAENDECTAALLLDVNPIELVRGRRGKNNPAGLFDYVNDRPYVASSFLSTAIARAFGTALGGRCAKRPELVDTLLDLTANIMMLPCYRGRELIEQLFEPLGYAVAVESFPLDEMFEAWGESRYFNVTITGKQRLCDLLSHIYVLIPVLDSAKHYWVSEDEIEKLLRHGSGWLEDHPMKEYIVSRYLKRRRRYINVALAQLNDEDTVDGSEDETESESSTADDPAVDIDTEKEEEKERKLNLNQRRLGSVVDALKESGARKVLDIGCGEGHLLQLLLKEKEFTQIVGMDVSYVALERAKDRLRFDRMPERQRDLISLFQGSLNYRDKRLAGFDAFAIVEVVEHMDQSRLSTFEKVVFAHAAPHTIVLTTPNREYNENYEHMNQGSLRHNDHRFEWTRDEFRAWATRVAEENEYDVVFSGIGDVDPNLGAPTQMGVFTK
jgi:3' terminal RNA ribose 2'-O-methyltransferase Hen1